MTTMGQHTHQEILSQPESWGQTVARIAQLTPQIAQLWQQRAWRQVILTGCGSPYYLSLAAAALLQELSGVPCRGVPASELWLNPAAYYPAQGDTLLVAVSRSGQTTEVINAVQAFRAAKRGAVATIVCEPDAPVSSLGDLQIELPWAREESVAQTRSFASMYVAASGLAAVCAGRDDLIAAMGRLPEIGRRLIGEHGARCQTIGANLDLERFYLLGSGLRYGLACELSLKMKEMTLSHSEPFHFLEFRHGPKSMVNERTLLVGLLSSQNARHEGLVIREMKALGAQTLMLAEEEGLSPADYLVAFGSALPEEARGVLYLPLIQLAAYGRSLAKGLNPDAPTNLDAVVRL